VVKRSVFAYPPKVWNRPILTPACLSLSPSCRVHLLNESAPTTKVACGSCMRLTCDRPIAPPFARRTAAHLFRNFLCSDDTPIALSLFKQVPRPSVNEGLGLAEVAADTQRAWGRPISKTKNTNPMRLGLGVRPQIFCIGAVQVLLGCVILFAHFSSLSQAGMVRFRPSILTSQAKQDERRSKPAGLRTRRNRGAGRRARLD